MKCIVMIMTAQLQMLTDVVSCGFVERFFVELLQQYM
jgi:hypothetical protein